MLYCSRLNIKLLDIFLGSFMENHFNQIEIITLSQTDQIPP